MVLHVPVLAHLANLRCSNFCLTPCPLASLASVRFLKTCFTSGPCHKLFPLPTPLSKWLGTSHLHPDHFFTALLSRYIHLSLEQHGFELCGFPYRGLFSIVNTAVLHDLQLVESMDAEGPCIQGANCNLQVVKGSTVPNLLVYNLSFLFTI